MRFKLTLRINRKYGDNLPYNYQYEQSAVIYRILAQADKQYSLWLHENGYSANGAKRFKLFTYSPFIFDRVHSIPKAGCLNIIGEYAVWYISFIPEKSTVEFIQGVFAHKQFTIGNKDCKVAFDIVGVESMPTPSLSEEMIFHTLSPICVKLHEGEKTTYLSPEEPQFTQGLLKGLVSRIGSITGKSLNSDTSNFEFTMIGNKSKSKLVTIKAKTPQETKVRGYLCDFKLKAPIELMQIAYEGGIGELCSQGFGFITKK